MKSKLFIFFIGLFVLTSISSCKKDFLERKPLDTYSELDVWTDINLVQTFVNSKYRALPHFYNWDKAVNGPGLSAAADEGYSKFNYEGVFLWNKGEVNPDNLSMDSWTGDYGFIRDCNAFFEKIAGVKGDDNMKKRMMGEMKFIRAWCYFNLTSRYGGVPLITKVYSLSDTDFKAARNTYDECMAFVVKEMDEALSMLPDSYSGNDLGRVTKGAALALKSRALLYAASKLNNAAAGRDKWQKAADAAKAVIDLPTYGLYQGSDYKKIFLEKFNSEIILSYGMNGTDWESYLDIMIAPNGYHGWSVYAPSQNLVDDFEMSNGKMIGEAGSGYDPANPYLNRDPRFNATIIYNGTQFRGRTAEYFKGGLDSPQSPVENWNASLTGYNWRKYADETHDMDATGSNQNWIVFRLAEIYLNYAEAQYELGNEPVARQYLNLVRSRTSVNMPGVNSTGTALIDAIRHEREIELCFEGHRFYDVRRWKIALQTENKPLRAVNITKNPNGSFSYSYFNLQERKFTEAHYLFPIPKYEIQKNNQLVPNPGY
ncbi:RagB/SusD family nutrient uptake outer membrane protein [Pedobacter nyackensis]|uniref:Starch-binding associating with outer membrane n=1 Tax=Pedobacter nyackensis TaxID=475255 RepID=A0A1W2F5M1_9SPHI|nr:RagB/SusD family nutrient uptake outer membrane protein [Pedobacter nyackensis]SMD17184.1 Starch-binding associating with outer membrane [Pedobacter nyackensis]